MPMDAPYTIRLFLAIVQKKTEQHSKYGIGSHFEQQIDANVSSDRNRKVAGFIAIDALNWTGKVTKSVQVTGNQLQFRP